MRLTGPSEADPRTRRGGIVMGSEVRLSDHTYSSQASSRVRDIGSLRRLCRYSLPHTTRG